MSLERVTPDRVPGVADPARMEPNFMKRRERLTDAQIVKLMDLFNLTYVELMNLRGGFCSHRCTKKVPFLFTFEEWLKVWIDSGHWRERGIRKGQYCMARFGDKGPYAVWNVKIILHSENATEGLIGNKNSLGVIPSEETRELLRIRGLGNQNAAGSIRSEKHKAAIGNASRGKQHALGHRWSPQEKLEITERSRKSWAERRKKSLQG